MQTQTNTTERGDKTLKLHTSLPPHFRLTEQPRDIMLSRLIPCAALLIPAIAIYGFRAVIMALSGMIGGTAIEYIIMRARGRENTLSDLSAVTTGLLCALLLPASAPIWLPLAAAAFAVGIVKLTFGGLGRSPFNAEAAGYCFAALLAANLRGEYNSALLSAEQRHIFELLPERCFGYVRESLPVFRGAGVSDYSVSDMLSTQVLLRVGENPHFKAVNFLFTGGRDVMGAVCAVLILLCIVWLVLRHAIAWQSAASYGAALIVLSVIFRYRGVPAWQMPFYELLTGSALLTAVFLAGDILTAPHTSSGRIVYGFCCAVLTVILRRTGSVEGGEVFAVLIMNAAASPIDRAVWDLRSRGISITAQMKKLSDKWHRKFGRGSRFGIDLEELYGSGRLDSRSHGVYVDDEMRRAVDKLYGTEDSASRKNDDEGTDAEGDDNGAQV